MKQIPRNINAIMPLYYLRASKTLREACEGPIRPLRYTALYFPHPEIRPEQMSNIPGDMFSLALAHNKVCSVPDRLLRSSSESCIGGRQSMEYSGKNDSNDKQQ